MRSALDEALASLGGDEPDEGLGLSDLMKPQRKRSSAFDAAMASLDQGEPEEEGLLGKTMRAIEPITRPLMAGAGGVSTMVNLARGAVEGDPLAHFKLSPEGAEGGVLGDIAGATGFAKPRMDQASAADVAMGGIGMLPALAMDQYDVRRDAESYAPGHGPGDDPLMRRSFAQANPWMAGAEAVAAPLAHLGMTMGTDPLMGGMEKLTAAAGKGTSALAALESGFLAPEAATAAQAALKTPLLAQNVNRALGASFIPGMALGAVEGGERFLEAGREHGYLSPEALGAGSEALTSGIMAGFGGYHALAPHALHAPGAPRESLNRDFADLGFEVAPDQGGPVRPPPPGPRGFDLGPDQGGPIQPPPPSPRDFYLHPEQAGPIRPAPQSPRGFELLPEMPPPPPAVPLAPDWLEPHAPLAPDWQEPHAPLAPDWQEPHRELTPEWENPHEPLPDDFMAPPPSHPKDAAELEMLQTSGILEAEQNTAALQKRAQFYDQRGMPLAAAATRAELERRAGGPMLPGLAPEGGLAPVVAERPNPSGAPPMVAEPPVVPETPAEVIPFPDPVEQQWQALQRLGWTPEHLAELDPSLIPQIIANGEGPAWTLSPHRAWSTNFGGKQKDTTHMNLGLAEKQAELLGGQENPFAPPQAELPLQPEAPPPEAETGWPEIVTQEGQGKVKTKPKRTAKGLSLGHLPTDSMPEHLRAEGNKYARQFSVTGEGDYSVADLPEHLKPHAKAIFDMAGLQHQATLNGHAMRERLRSRYGDKGEAGVTVESQGQPGDFDIVHRGEDGHIISGAEVRRNALAMIGGGRGLGEKESAGATYRKLDELGVERNDAVTVMGTETRRGHEARGTIEGHGDAEAAQGQREAGQGPPGRPGDITAESGPSARGEAGYRGEAEPLAADGELAAPGEIELGGREAPEGTGLPGAERPPYRPGDQGGPVEATGRAEPHPAEPPAEVAPPSAERERLKARIHAKAESLGLNPDAPKFKEWSKEVAGSKHLDDMAPDQLQKVLNSLNADPKAFGRRAAEKLTKKDRDEMGSPILPGQEDWAPEKRKAVRDYTEWLARELDKTERAEPTGPRYNKDRGFHGMRGKTQGTPFEGLGASPSKIVKALKRDEGNRLELEALDAVHKSGEWEAPEEAEAYREEPRDAYDEGDEGDASFNPEEFESGPKYAVRRPAPGQRGLPGFGEDVAAREEKKPERPKATQTSLFGEGEMLQGTERKGTEGREAGGSLFTQEQDARERREAGAQRTLGEEPQDGVKIEEGRFQLTRGKVRAVRGDQASNWHANEAEARAELEGFEAAKGRAATHKVEREAAIERAKAGEATSADVNLLAQGRRNLTREQAQAVLRHLDIRGKEGETLVRRMGGRIVSSGDTVIDSELVFKRAAEHLAQREATKPQPGLAFEGEQAPALAPETQRIEDYGEKIGGARKDTWAGRGLGVKDLEGMSAAEESTHVTKANIFKPDFAAMIEGGAEPKAAALMKVIYDRLAAKPRADTPEGRRRYLSMMEEVRETYKDVKTVTQLHDANLDLTSADWKDFEARERLFSVYKDRKNPFNAGYAEMRRAEDLVSKGFPNVEPWQRKYGVVGSGQGFSIYERGSRRFTGTRDQYKTREEAETGARQLYEEQKSVGGGRVIPTRPHLENLERKGADVRGGRDIRGEDFGKDFGFRGIEFGNWAAQDERQAMVNMGYEGLHDLATVIGVPPKAVSLDGKLGLAFGARGKGSALAHYEPDKLVINLTKKSGAGSLAHEWGHALDHYIGELERPSKGEPIFASGGHKVTTRGLPNVRPELADAWDGVMKALFKADQPQAEAVRAAELGLEKAQATLERQKKYLEDYKANPRDFSPENARRVKDWVEQHGPANVRAMEKRLEKARATDYVPEKVESSFYKSAQKLSGKSAAEGYWARPTELIARSFESYVFDKIKEKGHKSDYLVHGVGEGQHAADANPYPAGVERKALNAAYDKLFETIKTKETERGTAMYSVERGKQNERGFFSQLSRAMDETKQVAGKAEDWNRYLRDQKRGVKAEELKWTGLDDFLAARKGQKVTKQEIQDFLEQNEVQVEETTLGNAPAQKALEEANDRLVKHLVDDQDFTERGATDYALDAARGDLSESQLKAQDGLTRKYANQLKKAYNERNTSKEEQPTKFGQYQEPGGENYRELLLTMPEKPRGLTTLPKDARAISLQNDRWWVSNADGTDLSKGDFATKQEAIDAALKNINAGKFRDYGNERSFRSGHFGEPNILAHVRFNERTDADGKRVLFLEEVQSDWAQKGRREGFRTPEGELPSGYELLDMNAEARADGYDVPADAPEQWRFTSDSMTSKIYNSRAEAIGAATRDADMGGARPPSGPFVGKTEAWSELAMKRMIRWAAENGFDRIAWTKGEQQAARYDLSKQVSRVFLSDMVHAEGGEGLAHGDLVVTDKMGRDIITEKGVSPKRIEELIGKEAAERLINAPTSIARKGTPQASHELNGEGLKVGGEGMKGFYDKILPGVAGKLGKKFGAQVGETNLEPGVGKWKVTHPDYTTGNYGEFNTRAEAERLTSGYGPDEFRNRFQITQAKSPKTVHSMDITPEMRRSVVEQGQPLFAAGKSAQARHPLTIERVKAALPGFDFETAEDGSHVTKLQGGGELRVSPVGDILVTNKKALAESALAGGVEGEGKPVGSYQKIGRNGIIQIAKDAPAGTEHHEAFHFFFDRALSEKEKRAVLDKYGDEESAAYAYQDWTPKQVNSWFSKIMSYAKRLVHVFKPTWESTFQEARSGRAGERIREARGVEPGARFAAAAKTVGDRVENFKRWFGDAPPKELVNEDGSPRVVYHGTGAKFNRFSKNKATMGGITWFTSDKGSIEKGEAGAQGKGHVMDLYASLKNPAGWKEYDKFGLGELKSRGYDGAILPDKDGSFTGFVFEPTQLKSASKNRGTFDPKNPDIRYATAPPGPTQPTIPGLGMPATPPKKARLIEQVLEGFKGNILSGLGTHGVNISSVGVDTGYRMYETALSGVVDRMMGGERSRYSGAAKDELKGAIEAAPAGFKAFIDGMKKTFDSQGAIPGKAGKVFRAPFQVLEAGDAGTSVIGRSAELAKMAANEARRQGGSSAQIASKAAQLRAKPPAEWGPILDAKVKERQYKTEATPDGFIDYLDKAAKKNPVLEFVVPFRRTPGNVIKTALGRTPIGFKEGIEAYREYKAAERNGVKGEELNRLKGEAVDKLTKPIAGTIVMGSLYAMAQAGAMTGSGPTDPKQAAIWRKTGKQPYSFRVPDGKGGATYVPFARFQPVSNLLMLAADAAELKDTKKAGELWDKGIAMAKSSILNQPYLTGLADVAQFLNDPKSGSAYVTSLASAAVPNIVNKAAQALDPVYRDTTPSKKGLPGLPEKILNTWKSRIPGLSQTLPARRTATGDVDEREGNAFSRFASPIQLTSDKPEADVERLLLQADYTPSAPNRDFNVGRGVKVRLTDSEYQVLQDAQKSAAKIIRTSYARNPKFLRLDPEEQKKALAKVYEQERAKAREKLAKNRSFRHRAVSATREASI